MLDGHGAFGRERREALIDVVQHEPHVAVLASELVGAVLAWQNAEQARTERPAGCSPALIAFSALWAVECIPYYATHGDTLSAALAGVRCAGHALWSARALRWSRVAL